MISDMIKEYKLSIIFGGIEEPALPPVWHVISPLINKDAPRFSATSRDLTSAIYDVVSMMDREIK